MTASSQSINFGDILPLGTGSFTFTGWVKTTMASSNPIIAKMADAVEWWRIVLSGGKLQTAFDDNIVNAGMTGTTDIDDGVWHFFAVTRLAGTGFNMYIDAKAAEDSIFDTGNLTTGNTADVHIGFQESGSVNFEGHLADMRVYNIALTDAQTKSHYYLQRHKYGAES